MAARSPGRTTLRPARLVTDPSRHRGGRPCRALDRRATSRADGGLPCGQRRPSRMDALTRQAV